MSSSPLFSLLNASRAARNAWGRSLSTATQGQASDASQQGHLGFYLKIAAACFCLGASMETFMIKTGFYEKVVDIEAQRLEETREEREAFLRDLKRELERQASERKGNLHLPPSITSNMAKDQR